MLRCIASIVLAALALGATLAAAQGTVKPPLPGVKLQPRSPFSPKPKNSPAPIKVQTAPAQPRPPAVTPNKPAQPPPFRPEDVLKLLPGLVPPEPNVTRSNERRRSDSNSSRPRSSPATPSKPAAPSDRELAALSPDALRQLLQAAAERLDRQLSAVRGGDGWKQYLQTNELRRLLASDQPLPPDDATRETLRKIAERLVQTAEQSQYRVIAEKDGFATLRAGLKQFVEEPPGSPHVADSLSANDLLRKLVEETKKAKEAERARIAEVLAGLFGDKESSPSKDNGNGGSNDRLAARLTRLQGLALRHPASLSLAEAQTLRRVAANWKQAQAQADGKILSLREVPSFGPAMSAVQMRAARFDRFHAEWSRQAREFLLLGNKPRPQDSSGVLTLLRPDDDSPEAIATLLQFTDEPESSAGATLLQFDDDDPPPAATIMALGTDEPRESPASERPDYELAAARFRRSLTVANLNRWLEPERQVWLDRWSAESPEGHSPGATVTLVGTKLSPDAAQNSIVILKRLADGSLGTLATMTPRIASQAGTALEWKLPGDIEPGQYLVRVVVVADGVSQPTNVLELNVATPPLPPPVLASLSPNPQAAFQKLTIEGERFGGAAFIELKFRPRESDSAPGRTTLAQVLNDRQLAGQVPPKLPAGEYLVAVSRQGRLSNWLPLTVCLAGPAASADPLTNAK